MGYDHWKTPPPARDDDPWPLDIDPGPDATDYGTRPLLGDWLAGLALLALIVVVGFLFLTSGAP